MSLVCQHIPVSTLTLESDDDFDHKLEATESCVYWTPHSDVPDRDEVLLKLHSRGSGKLEREVPLRLD